MYIYLWVIGVKLCVYLRVHACSWADFFTSLYSQAMKQWWQLKVDNFDTILFFKVLCELQDCIINSLNLISWQDENFVPWLATWADKKEWSCPFRTKKAEKSFLFNLISNYIESFFFCQCLAILTAGLVNSPFLLVIEETSCEFREQSKTLRSCVPKESLVECWSVLSTDTLINQTNWYWVDSSSTFHCNLDWHLINNWSTVSQ